MHGTNGGISSSDVCFASIFRVLACFYLKPSNIHPWYFTLRRTEAVIKNEDT
jgi:hypothetical protein